MKLIQRNLGQRIVGLMIVASAMLSLIAASFQLYFSYNRDLDRVTSELDIVEKSFQTGLERAVWQFDFAQVEAALEGIFAQVDVVYLRLETTTGQSFSLGEPPDAAEIQRNYSLNHTTTNGETEFVGELTVVASLAEARSRLISQFLEIVGSNFVKTFLASLIMLFIFDRMVSRHLRHIAEQVSAYKWPSLHKEITIDRGKKTAPDEVDRILSALNESAKKTYLAERAAHIFQGRLETVLNAATSGILAMDASGKVLIANSRLREMLRVPDSTDPFQWPDTIRFLDKENMSPLEASADPIRRILTGHTVRNETQLMALSNHPDNQRYVRIDSARTNEEDQEISAVVVIDDISEQEKTRQVVERHSRLDALGQLTGGIAHDFNNLLGSMLYAVDMAAEEEDKTERNELLASANRSIRKGRDLTSRLLAFAKKQPGASAAKPVSDVFRDFLDLITPMLEARIDLTVDLDVDGLVVYCDQTQLETALMNLVLNSRDAILRSGKGDRIKLSARAIDENVFGVTSSHTSHDTLKNTKLRHGMVEISVSDNGPGMDSETRIRATDPFFTTKDTNSGTGLGLSMVYGFMQQSDGVLRIYSEPKVGTTIQLLLQSANPSQVVITDAQADLDYDGQGQTVLLVEDEPELAENMRKALERLNFEVVVAYNGKEALTVLDENAGFAFVITDIVMPGQIGGFELAALIGQKDPNKPILFMSGYTGFSEEERRGAAGDILQKPTTRNELIRAIKAVLHQP